MDSTKKTARLAGLLYLVSSLPAPFALIYVPGKLLVKGDAAATADRIRTSEGLLRDGIAVDLVFSVVFIFMVLVLYRLFKPVAEGPALSMVVSDPALDADLVHERCHPARRAGLRRRR